MRPGSVPTRETNPDGYFIRKHPLTRTAEGRWSSDRSAGGYYAPDAPARVGLLESVAAMVTQLDRIQNVMPLRCTGRKASPNH